MSDIRRREQAQRMDNTDRRIINALQTEIPVCDHPYAECAAALDMSEDELLRRLAKLRETGILSRIGPMYHAERLGGGLALVAMRILPEDFERVAEQVNAFDEVAHNYERDHVLNMWFVLATETAERVNETLSEIEEITGYPTYNMPKIEEFFVGLRFEV
jgi:DNA-binding Lrp family transcriptional regulator